MLGTGHPDYPIVEMASCSRTIKIGTNLPEPPNAQDNPTWMRWNNLGIGYLDQLQYSDAIHAFQEVVKLRPDYTDGYTNLGLTNFEWEKYADAKSALKKALALSPVNPRALYYVALVERQGAHADEEVADLIKVVAMNPQSRDARRELGISYYQQDENELAMEEFEALQAIDPDDLAAHYNLAILYRRAGMKEKSRFEAVKFKTKKQDPGAPTYSLDYLRKHPEISTESVPWHLHTDLFQERAPNR